MIWGTKDESGKRKLMEKYGLTEADIEQRKLNQSNFTQILAMTTRQRMQHTELLAKVSDDEFIKGALEGDPNYEIEIKKLYAKAKELNPELVKVINLEGIEDLIDD